MPRREQYLEKPLPSNDEAEKTILGAVLLDSQLMETAAVTLAAEEFYSPLYRRIFAAMLELHRERKPIDPITIGEVLKREGSIDAVGGFSAITNLTYGLPHFSNIDQYIEIVREKAALRSLIRTCASITSEALAEESPGRDVLATAQNRINDLCLKAEEGRSEERFVSLAKVLETDVARYIERLEKGETTKIATGFDRIDRQIGGGIAPSDVLLLGANTGSGKSALALQMAYQIAAAGTPVAFLAGEMTNGENVNRLLSQLARITNLNSLQGIAPYQAAALREWAKTISHVPMYFDHRTGDLQTLATFMRSMVRRQGVRVLVIDYVQLFKLERFETRKRTERIADLSQEVKRLANELDLAIIEVGQFNRLGAKSERPTVHDFDGSGQLEKDASLVFLLALQEGYARDPDGNYRTAKLYIDKGRNTGTCEIEGKYYGATLRFDFT